MPLQSTSGAASYDAFGGGTTAKVNYIEDFFQSYLRTGTGASATVTTGLDGSTKETLVWTKSRSAATNHKLTDNVRGATKALSSNTTGAEATDSQGLTAFSATGYTIGTNTDYNNSGATYVDWQWVSQPKFFDVVTYTGDAVSTGYQSIPIPASFGTGADLGCYIVKNTSNAEDWYVWHRGNPVSDDYGSLNSTAAFGSPPGERGWGVSGNTFVVGGGARNNNGNRSGNTYVAYLFAHNAGGFGLTGTDNVISCGSVSVTNSTQSVSVGYEPQWILWKKSSGIGSWWMFDTMRGLVVDNGSGTGDKALYAELSNAETGTYGIDPTATGFQLSAGWGAGDYIYIAIRRGPMKVPTSGTSVFNTMLVTGNGTNERQITGVGFPPDLLIGKRRSSALLPLWFDKLRGKERYLDSSSTSAETALAAGNEGLMLQDGFVIDNNYGSLNVNGSTYADWVMRRAPSFFDEVCYTGTGVAGRTVTHNLTVVPELMIVKGRSNAGQWRVYSSALGATQAARLNSTDSFGSNPYAWNDTAPTASVFTVGDDTGVNQNTYTYVAYLFATCAGVSKVGSYTGTGATQTISCGFTGGARFVLIKKTSGTGSWYVWDSSRGIVSGNDPYLLLNSTAAEVTNTDYIDTYSAGFEISSTAPSEINENGGSFIFLAIA